MSIWTHVNAIMRVDNIDDSDSRVVIGEFLKSIPSGTEGSLRYSIADDRTENTVNYCVISIFGDLRDVEDSEYIKEWFLDFCNSLFIRSAIIEIKVEGKSYELLKYDWEKRILV